MPIEVSLKVVNQNGENHDFVIKTENKKFINSIITVNENNEITEEQKNTLLTAAAKCGKSDILENCDLSFQQKINLANLNGFDKFYDLKLSKDGKFLVMTVKETNMFIPRPTIGRIKTDFGIKNGVLVQKGSIPYGNEDVISCRHAQSGEEDYDIAKLLPGDKLNIPIEEVHFDDKPRTALGRLLANL